MRAATCIYIYTYILKKGFGSKFPPKSASWERPTSCDFEISQYISSLKEKKGILDFRGARQIPPEALYTLVCASTAHNTKYFGRNSYFQPRTDIFQRVQTWADQLHFPLGGTLFIFPPSSTFVATPHCRPLSKEGAAFR